MGNEFAQGREWRSSWELDWWQLGIAQHQNIQKAARDLNRLYRELPALYQQEFEQAGFNWLDCEDAERSLLSYLRWGNKGEVAVVALNLTPVPRSRYRIGLPYDCTYREVFNSDSNFYGGSNMGNGFGIKAEQVPWMGQPFSAEIELPPLAGIILCPA
jgi:1,4-alpha-glucan branching enzyme